MATFIPVRGTKAEIEATPKVDGQILFETDQGYYNKAYLDIGTGTNDRISVGGANSADMNYNPLSTNAQSGIAVAQAVDAWIGTANIQEVSGGSAYTVTFSEIDDSSSGLYDGYELYCADPNVFIVNTSVTGSGTTSMSVTYTVDGANIMVGTSCKLRGIKK